MGLEPSAPAVIGHYSVEHVIGAGGMGVVYQARDTKLDRPVAIKAIADRLLLKPGALDRLRSEARAAAQLDHPYVCRVYELVETGTNVYIVMEYVEGETLRDRLRRGPLPYPDAIRLSTEIAEGLADAHARGLVHRDVKPANVIITPHGHVKILDFGLARRDVSSPADAVTEEKLHTSIGAGTPQYMAPEQAAGRPITARADVYAIGVVLFECLTGSRPFDDGAALNVALARVAPPEIVRLVARCLEPNPVARFENAGAVAAELRTLLPSSDSLAGAPPVKQPWWRRRRTIIEITAAAFAIAASIWIATRPRVVTTTFDLVHFDAEPSTEFDSRISPDGKLVSFISDRLGTGQLFVKEATGGNVIHVDTGVSDVLTHVWSPDGSECAVVVHQTGSYRGVLQIFRATFGGSPRLTIELDENLVAFRASRWVNNAVYLQAEDRTAPGNRALLLRVPLADGAPPVNVSASWKLPGDLNSLDVNPAGDKAVLAVSVAGQEDLFVMGLDGGSAPVRLTDDAIFQRRPIWSGPNAVVFQSNQNGQSDLWEMDLRSKTSAPVLTGPEEETAESASTDGSVITLKQFSVSADLWAIAEPGQPSRELTAGEIGSFAPSMSADGRFLAVQRLQPSADRADPFADSVIEAGPLVASGLLATTRVDAGAMPMLSPDGSRIAYLQKTGGTTYRLLVRVLAGTKSEIVSTQPKLPSYAPNRLDWGNHPFSWSPDGRILYFVENSALRTFVVGTGPAPEPFAQVPGESLQDPVVSRDGRSLAFLSQKGGVYRLHILDLASHEDAVMVLNAGHKSGMTLNRGWSRDGRSVVLIRVASPVEHTAMAEVIIADRRASRVVASVPGGLAVTAFLDAFRGALYLTEVEPAGHRVVAVSLPAGTLTELKQTSNPRVTFSGLATANGGPIIGVQDERRTGVWLARRRVR